MAWRYQIEDEDMTHTAPTLDQLVTDVRQMHPEVSEDDIRAGAEEIPDDELGDQEDVGEGAAEGGIL